MEYENWCVDGKCTAKVGIGCRFFAEPMVSYGGLSFCKHFRPKGWRCKSPEANAEYQESQK